MKRILTDLSDFDICLESNIQCSYLCLRVLTFYRLLYKKYAVACDEGCIIGK